MSRLRMLILVVAAAAAIVAVFLVRSMSAPKTAAASTAPVTAEAVAPKPVNVLVGSPGWTVAQLAELGVRRISVGGALARTLSALEPYLSNLRRDAHA